jgi:TrmH family RNA methyltransferase
LDGKSVYEYVPPEKSVLIFSNEALGPSEEILELADDVITIPRFGNAESLNVANSAAVIFSEFAGSQLRRK